MRRYFQLPGLIGLGAMGAALITKRYTTLHLLLLFIAAQLFFCVYSGGDWMTGWRFIVPIIPLLVIIIVWMERQYLAKHQPYAQLVVAAIAVFYLSTNYLSIKPAVIRAGFFPTAARLQETVSNWNPSYKKVVAWLADHPAIQTVAAGELGFFWVLFNGKRC